MNNNRADVDVERYRREGFLTVPGVLSPDRLEVMRLESDRLMRLCYKERERYERRIEWEVDHLAPVDRPGMDKVIRKLEPVSDLSPVFREFAFAPEITGPVSAIFNEPIGLFEDKLNLKLPGGSPYPWHQDWVCCWKAHTDQLVTCFVYLDDADAHNGCLQVVPCSHQGKPILPFKAGGHFEVDPGCVDPARVQAVPLKAGEMIFFDPYLLHYSDLNRSHTPRRAIIYTYHPARLGQINDARFPADFSPHSKEWYETHGKTG